MEVPTDVVPSVEAPLAQGADTATKAALTPPTSEDNDKRDERMSSELSDIDSDDGEDIEPDHYFEGGKIPVFKPVRNPLRNWSHVAHTARLRIALRWHRIRKEDNNMLILFSFA